MSWNYQQNITNVNVKLTRTCNIKTSYNIHDPNEQKVLSLTTKTAITTVTAHVS